MKKNLKLYISYLSHTFDFVSVEQFIHEITRKYFNNQTKCSDGSKYERDPCIFNYK